MSMISETFLKRESEFHFMHLDVCLGLVSPDGKWWILLPVSWPNSLLVCWHHFVKCRYMTPMTQLQKRRLILVSNRLPFQLLEKNGKISLKESDGGLVSALKSFSEREEAANLFDEKWWVGSADFPSGRWEKYLAKSKLKHAFEIAPIFIESKVYNKYYNGFCNATLWPLFHYFPS